MAVFSLLLKDFIAEQSNAPGTGTYNLGIAVAGRQSWVSGFANGASVYYYATDGIQFECGVGTLTYGTPNTLARTQILANSSGTTSAINFTGLVTVYNEVPAKQTVTADCFTTGGTSANYWRQSPDGYIEQWGTVTTSTGGTVSITFVKPFLSNVLVFANLAGGSAGATPSYEIGVSADTLTTATFYSNNYTGTAVSGVGIVWQARGF